PAHSQRRRPRPAFRVPPATLNGMSPCRHKNETDPETATATADGASEVALAEMPPMDELDNGDLARIFHEIGDMLEVKGELVFKTVAYHRAADAIGRSPVDLVAAYRSGTPPRIPGVG